MSTNPKPDVFANLARGATALSSRTRIEFLELLAQAERSVEQLATLTGTTVANTSQHLQKLRQAGLIVGRKVGLFVFYRLPRDEGGGVLSGLGPGGGTRRPAAGGWWSCRGPGRGGGKLLPRGGSSSCFSTPRKRTGGSRSLPRSFSSARAR